MYGINIDSLNPHCVTSFAENQVFVWDMRNFDKPFVVLNHGKPVVKAAWCPTRYARHYLCTKTIEHDIFTISYISFLNTFRSGLLATIEKDSSFITLYDVHHATLSVEEADQAVLERRLSPVYAPDVESNKISPLSSFAWHPQEENLVTTAAVNGD